MVTIKIKMNRLHPEFNKAGSFRLSERNKFSQDEYERGKSVALVRRINYSSDEVAQFLKRPMRTSYERGFRDGLLEGK